MDYSVKQLNNGRIVWNAVDINGNCKILPFNF
jgi:hypothetical protein